MDKHLICEIMSQKTFILYALLYFKVCLSCVLSVVCGRYFPLFILSLCHTTLLGIKTHKNTLTFSEYILHVNTHMNMCLTVLDLQNHCSVVGRPM